MNTQVARNRNVKDRTPWRDKVRVAIEKTFPDSPNYRASIMELWDKFEELELPNAHFVSELTSGKLEVVRQRVWEMMLARHFDAEGYKVSTAAEGPDFLIELDGRRIWVEAICPEAKGLPPDWLEPLKPGEFKVGDVPHNETLLRWTAAIKEKSEKLQRYREKGIVGPDDAYIIAVNGSQLSRMPLNHGISQLPYAVEAVYAAGPTTINIDRTTGIAGEAYISVRSSIPNAKGKPVSTTVFLDKESAGVSAIIAYSHDRSEDPSLPLDVVHNHYASTPISKGVLGSDNDEWGTDTDGKGGIVVKKLDDTQDGGRSPTTDGGPRRTEPQSNRRRD